jgi:SAM-dependent methyltransferase
VGTVPGELYDTLGRTYAAVRVEDPRIGAQIHRALGDARHVVNVGAGAGSYEPKDRAVVAVEPSLTMVRQRPAGSAPVVLASAEALPVGTDAFDAAMALLTIHHWHDVAAGLSELRRVSRRQVILYFEPLASRDFWLLHYLPEIADLPVEQRSPGRPQIERALGPVVVEPVLVPPDCRDGFAAAYWARPEAYLDPIVQAGISSLSLLDDNVRDRGVRRLEDDLSTGRWDERFGHHRSLPSFDGGYRLAIAQR